MQLFDDLENRVQNMIHNILDAAGDEIIKMVQENIDNADSLYTPSIKPPTLYKTGNMRNNFTKEIDQTSVTVTNDMPYSGIHNTGGKFIPKRPYGEIDLSDLIDKIAKNDNISL